MVVIALVGRGSGLRPFLYIASLLHLAEKHRDRKALAFGLTFEQYRVLPPK
jgi:hypothetical protein